MIRQLQEEILQKDGLLKKAAEDMKFYKLELINREENFNKMFGTNPMVGVMDPLANKPQTSKPGRGTIGGPTKALPGGMMMTGGNLNQKDIARKNSRIS